MSFKNSLFPISVLQVIFFLSSFVLWFCFRCLIDKMVLASYCCFNNLLILGFRLEVGTEWSVYCCKKNFRWCYTVVLSSTRISSSHISNKAKSKNYAIKCRLVYVSCKANNEWPIKKGPY